jgi:transposase
MSTIYELRVSLIQSWIKKEIKRGEVCKTLACSIASAKRYKRRYLQSGSRGLKDKRHSNNNKLTLNEKDKLEKLKVKDGWRSARNIRDKLKLKVNERRVQQVFKILGLNHQNKIRVKAITRFESEYPNQMWQADIMGRIDLPKLGRVYLIGNLDDHSRFCLGARFFKTQSKINVFLVWLALL